VSRVRSLIPSAVALMIVAFVAQAQALAIIGVDDAAHRALSADAKERRAGTQRLLANGDRGSIAVLIELLRWLPGDATAIVRRLERLTNAQAGSRWLDWMLWQQAHPEVSAYPGYAGFLADLLAGIDPRFRRFLRAVVLIGDAQGLGARAYRSDGHHFDRATSPDELLSRGGRWHVTEAVLLGPDGESLPRLPGHVAYWFAWAGYFEDVQLGGVDPSDR
jgi:hypothetical protein